jgi:D-alanyl-D-alanine carboxypeptidase (penicillin-binding protein 5/6)
MSNKQFAQIVSTKQYYCVCPETGREFRWKNTHKLLEEDGWCGVKTGVTPAAGPCLASCYGRGRQGRVFVVLLGCETMELRY